MADMPPTEGRLDAAWLRLTDEGNQAMAAGRTRAAGALYVRALTEAEYQFAAACAGRQGLGAEAAPMLVASLANLSEVHARMGEAAVALDVCVDAVRRLRAAVVDDTVPRSFRRACSRHLGAALLELAARAGPASRDAAAVAQEVERTRRAVLAFIEADEHSPGDVHDA